MAADEARQDVGQIGVGVHAGEFAAFDKAGEDGPVVSPFVTSGEE